MPLKTTGYVLIALLAIPISLSAQTPRNDSNQESCRKTVQDFYSWYVPRMRKGSTAMLPPSRALGNKKAVFSGELLKQLDEDFQASAKNADEIVGLDFDPYLNSQDPGERYVTGTAAAKGNSCSVEVFAVSSGKKSAKPDVWPELMLKNGRWEFVNFRYGNGKADDLTSILAKLKSDRQKPAK